MNHYFFVEYEDEALEGYSTNVLKEVFDSWAGAAFASCKVHMEIVGEDGGTVYEADFELK